MLNLSGVKNIIFDFGGVIINIDFNLSYKAFYDLGVSNLEEKFSQAKQTSLFDQFEKGDISPQYFRNEAKQLLNLNVSDQKFDFAWNAMILNIPTERIALLKKLSKEYRLFLLSNSNQIHYNLYLNDLKTTYGFSDFDEIFEKAYFSFNMGMIKPHPEIFNYVISQHNLIQDETLFIDDSIQHIEAANKLGLRTYFLNETNVTEIFP